MAPLTPHGAPLHGIGGERLDMAAQLIGADLRADGEVAGKPLRVLWGGALQSGVLESERGWREEEQRAEESEHVPRIAPGDAGRHRATTVRRAESGG